MYRSNRNNTSRAETDRHYGKNPGGATPDGGSSIRKKRLEAIKAATERLEVAQTTESGP